MVCNLNNYNVSFSSLRQLDVLLWFVQRVYPLSLVQLAANITLTQCSPGNLGLGECFVSAVCVISQWLGQSSYFLQCRQEHQHLGKGFLPRAIFRALAVISGGGRRAKLIYSCVEQQMPFFISRQCVKKV